MTELSKIFQSLPIDIINNILLMIRVPTHLWYLYIDEKKGKLEYRYNVKLHIKKIPDPLETRLWRLYKQSIAISIGNTEFVGFRYCYMERNIERRGYDQEILVQYIEYENNKKMEYIQYLEIDDAICECKLFRINEMTGRYVQYPIHLDERRQKLRVTILPVPDKDFINECIQFVHETDRLRSICRNASQALDLESREKWQIGLKYIDEIYNPALNIFESIPSY
jgi:hypothetical protein